MNEILDAIWLGITWSAVFGGAMLGLFIVGSLMALLSGGIGILFLAITAYFDHKREVKDD